MYSIGEVSKKFGLSVSTLRYYDKEGLIPDLERTEAGIRVFTEKSLDAINVIECLKKSGLQIKEIKQFMDWCEEGDTTLEERKQLFYDRKRTVQQEIQGLQKVLQMLEYKCWFYEEAIKDGTDEKVKNLKEDEMPKAIRRKYVSTHQF